MKYNIIINQEAAIRLNLDVDYLDLAIFDCVSNILNCPEFPSLLIPSTGRTFKWISTKLILKELPLLGLKERAIRTRLDKLETSKLLLKYVDTRDGNKPYYAQGANFSAMFRTDADPRNLDADPRNLDADPRNLDADPRNLDADIDNNTNNNTNNFTMYKDEAKNEFSPVPTTQTQKHSFSKENGLIPGNLNVRQSTIDKIDAAFEQLVFPIDDAEIKKLFFVLCCSPKWRGKTVHALQMSLNKVQNYDRDFTIKLIEDSIAGGWQGLVFENTDRKYQDYLKAKKGGISFGKTTFNVMSEQERKEALEYLNM